MWPVRFVTFLSGRRALWEPRGGWRRGERAPGM